MINGPPNQTAEAFESGSTDLKPGDSFFKTLIRSQDSLTTMLMKLKAHYKYWSSEEVGVHGL